jgi:HEAT repeat protein
MTSVAIPSSAQRLLNSLLSALLCQGPFSHGRSGGQRALIGLGEDLCRWLEQNPRIVFLAGNPAEPLICTAFGFAAELIDPNLVVDSSGREESRLHLAGFWRDRRIALLSLRQGLTAAEFDRFYHLLNHHDGKGRMLRSRLFEEQTRGHLPHVSMIFLDDLPADEPSLAWPARVSLAWLHRDLNLLSRAHGLPTRNQVDWREQLLGTSLDLSSLSGKLAEFFANLNLIAEEIDNYDKDELVFALLEHLDGDLQGELCLQLCALIERLPLQDIEEDDPVVKERRTAIQWVARRLAEEMIEQGRAGPEHLHALVLHKVLLYEEIPRQMRPRVASLQVLTSFLANPQKYFSEVESSHSPEVLETRLWRILEMLPKLVQALRFDVACQVLDFSRRFGATFDLQNKPEIMAQLMDAAAGVLTETQRDQQVALMNTLPQMGQAGVHLLIDLADHHNRSVRRAAIDALLKIGQPVVPVLFEILAVKQGWHYLRNMLLLLAQLEVGGPKVERLFHKCLVHPEANVRKEALSGITRLLREKVAVPVAAALDDVDLEVQKRAAACLGLTGIANPKVYKRLAEILAAKNCSEELAVQIVASINRLKPHPSEDLSLESALLDLIGAGGFLGIGGRKGSASSTLRMAAVQALGFVGTGKSRKVLLKLSSEHNPAMASAVAEALKRLTARHY